MNESEDLASEESAVTNRHESVSYNEGIGGMIRRTLQSGGGGMMGARLGVELSRHRINPSALGFASLTALMKAECPDAISAPTNGGDLYWRLAGSPTAVVPPNRAEVWRALASPGSAKHVAVKVSRKSGMYRIDAVGQPDAKPEAVDDDWATLPPIDATALKKAAEQFAESLASSRTKEQLTAALPLPSWWLHWGTVLREHGEDMHRWMEAKNAAVHRHLVEVLMHARLEGETLERASQFPAPGPIAPRLAASARIVSPVLSRTSNFGSRDTRGDVRDLVVSLLPHMDESDIRSLRVPIGIVFDMLKRSGR